MGEYSKNRKLGFGLCSRDARPILNSILNKDKYVIKKGVIMKKIVFLDIDGVVNTLQIDTQPIANSKYKEMHDGFYFDICNESDKRVSDRQAIMWLNKLCRVIKADIVISSTWRLHPGASEEALYNSGLDKDIKILGYTPWLPGDCRGDEIQAWLNDNVSNENCAIVILDDDSDMGHLMEYLVKCNTWHGFKYPEYYQALEIIEKQLEKL